MDVKGTGIYRFWVYVFGVNEFKTYDEFDVWIWTDEWIWLELISCGSWFCEIGLIGIKFIGLGWTSLVFMDFWLLMGLDFDIFLDLFQKPDLIKQK